jgi:cell division protein ZapA (FtsZ GTPase activity inhibitor)
MACEDGREGYLMNLAREIDNRINGLRSKSSGISDNGLMVMMAITLADELAEAGQRIKRSGQHRKLEKVREGAGGVQLDLPFAGKR